MSATIENVYVETFERSVRHLAQQGVNRLRPFVQEVRESTEAHNFERIAATTATQKTTRKTATPDDETAWSRRKAIPVEYHTGDVTEKKDIVQMLVDPNSNYARAHAKAMRRAQDSEIISAAVGDSRDGDGNAITFPTAQVVGDGSAAINFDIVTEVTEKFMDNDIDPDMEKIFVISPEQARKLLQLTEATSGDYNAVRPLTTKGYIDSWMGFTWVVSTLLTSPTGNGSDVDCFAMTRDAIGMLINQDIMTEVGKDPSISFAWRIYTNSIYGAIRVEDEQLVKVTLSTTI
jgi:hypothetical protein